MIKNLDDLYEKMFDLIKRLIQIDHYDLAHKVYGSMYVSQSQYEVFGECRNRIREIKKLGLNKKLPNTINLNELERFFNKL